MTVGFFGVAPFAPFAPFAECESLSSSRSEGAISAGALFGGKR